MNRYRPHAPVEVRSPEIPEDVDSPDWQKALHQVADLKAALSNNELTAEVVEELAKRWGTSVRTVWRRVCALRREGGLRAFLQQRRGPNAGVGKLRSDSKVERRRQSHSNCQF